MEPLFLVEYAESASSHGDYFTLSLCFGANQASPDILAAVPVNSSAFTVASASNGLGLLECFGAYN